jgi:cation transport regulator
MPHDRNADLPKSVRDSLPKDAQTIYRKAFNNAWEQYRQPDRPRAGSSREEGRTRIW